MSLPAKAPHTQLDTKTHQVIIQRTYIRNDKHKPMSPAEIERELRESNGINKTMLALPPRILIARRTMDSVDHGPIMVAFRDETDAAHCKTYGVFLRGDHCYARDYIETKRINRCFHSHELTLSTRSCSHKPRCVHCASTEHTSTEHADNECKECGKDRKYPHNNLKCVNYNGNHAANDRAARCG